MHRATGRRIGVVGAAALLLLGHGAAVGAGAAPAPGDQWLTARGGDLRQGTADSAATVTAANFEDLAPQWDSGTPSERTTEAIVSGGAVYVIGPDSLSRRKAADGTVVWSLPTSSNTHTPTLDGGRLWVLDGQRLLALNPGSGAVIREVASPGYCSSGVPQACFSSGIGVEKGNVVVGNGARFSIVDGDTGETLKVRRLEGDDDSYGGGTPAIDPRGFAWYSYKFTGVLSVPPTTGNRSSKPFVTGNGYAVPLVLDDHVYITSTSKGISRIGLAAGRREFLNVEATGDHTAMATDGDRLFDVTSDRRGSRLTAYDVASGSARWSAPGAVTAPIVVGDLVIVGEGGAGLAAYDAESGTEVGRIPGEAGGANPVVVGGALYAGFSAAPLPAGVVPPLTKLSLPGG